ncbi:HsmA family protein [Desulfitobacterium metallireducens]|uniref:Membrane protein n=1 Tax=Desulfitobacterium metallireducens DSM 15288 TaxID=871968 RepID=W0EAB4_9FIRM|nr:membrane protein [Desulfitobacterium metallireducens DSM 15288]
MVFIFLALIIYSIGVWSERFQGRLKWWHVAMFYVGLACDTIGTGAMSLMSGGLIQFTFHGMTGLAAIIIMVFHAVWATRVLIKENEILIVKFHEFSLVVWIIWLIPMITGGIFGATV